MTQEYLAQEQNQSRLSAGVQSRRVSLPKHEIQPKENTMTRPFIPAAILALFAALPAAADQFAVRIDHAYGGASPQLLEVLKVSEIESFSENGRHFVVLEAPGEAYVEAFFHAIGRNALELNALDADWTNPAMQHLSIAQRLGFLREIDCGFCTS
ncbi:hypothetical protein [Aestuariicoccus sp. MJ-SS9]|uniref:hypothetical protein n=1 Tax=Aestuariicoccus sp. MJ-SS9 TaxID=3079855 RepID=UPI00290EEBFA|nr:hypothetical protein [Aestuariicoccus sp. MJ-SS9]MDU8912327.1 hypothetical protein [Aestuariicoccus sp. MJ-SS9]